MIQTSTSLKYEPSLELLRITAEQLYLNHQPPDMNYIEILIKVDFPADSSFKLQSAGEINLCESLDIVRFWWLLEVMSRFWT